MLSSEEVIKQIESQQGAVTSKILCDLISDNIGSKQKMIRLWNEYGGDTPIKTRSFPNPNKINRHIADDFRGIIVDQAVGYMFGKPIEWQVDGDNYSEVVVEKVEEAIKQFTDINAMDDLDNTTATYCGVCGQAARLLYVDVNGVEKVMNVKPWEAIFIYDSTLEEVQYGMIYYDVQVQRADKSMETKIKVEWYDDTTVTYYIGTIKGGFALDETKEVNPQVHLFDGIPLIHFKNNDGLLGDFEKVADLIDNYDRLISDVQNELEEFRMAYLVAYGVEPSADVMNMARQTGMFAVTDKDGKMEFLTKTLNGEVVEAQKNTLKSNIYLFSKTVDMSDEKFSGATQSGESRKWKLIDLENKAINKERKYNASLKRLVNVLLTAWAKKGLVIDPQDIQFVFKRNLPVENADAVKLVSGLKDIVSHRTLLEQLPFITSVDAELQRIEDERTIKVPSTPSAAPTTAPPTPMDMNTESNTMSKTPSGDMMTQE